MGIVRVNNIKVFANHGCMEQETAIGQYFFVDVELFTDFQEGAVKDDLSLTVDYVQVNQIVVREMKTPSKLIEHAGLRILNALKTEIKRPLSKTIVTVRKPNPPINGNVDHVEVVLEG